MLKRTFVNLLLVFAILLSLVSTTSAAPLAQQELTYTVKLGDNLWTLAEKYLGSGPAYWAIVGATSAKRGEDASYAFIENPSLIHPGWKLLIPSADEAQKYIALAKAGPPLVIGINAEYPPFESVDEASNIIGFDPDLMVAIADAAGFTFEWVNTRWDGIFVALASGEFDAVISAATITEERAEVVDFSDPYFEAGQAIVVRADETEIETADDLAGKKVGVQLGTTGDIWLTDETEAEVVRYDENTLAFQALAAGDVDAAVMDNPTAAEIVKANPELNLKLLPGVYTEENYGIAVRKDRPEVLEAINRGLAAVKTSGEYDAIWDKWFGALAEQLIIGTTDSWTSFEMAWQYSFHDWELYHQCADGLLNAVPGAAGEVEPALAESYTVSDDGLEYTFKIREGVVFPNGDPLTADAVVWTINRVWTIEEIEGSNANFLVTGYVDSVEKVDDMTVKVTFNAPYAFAPQLIATSPWKIINPNQWTDTEGNTNNTACGIGPYTIASFTEGEELIFEANPTYYGDPPKMQKVIVRYFADSPTMALALQTGEIDIAWKSLAPADLVALEGVAGITIQEAGSTEIRYITYNSTIAPYDNPKVRLGLAMLLDREELTDLGWQGIKVPLWSMVPPGFLGYKPTYQGTEDVEAGKALLAEAGFTEDNPLVLDLWYSPTHYGDTEVDVATVIKQQWEASGVVKAELQFLEWAAYRQAQRDSELPVSLLGWYPDYLDPDNYTNVFAHSPASWSGSFYSNPEMDALLDAQGGELDEATRIGILEDIQDLWVTESPFVPLAQGKLFIGYRDGISNVILDPLAQLHYFLIQKVE